MSLLKIRERVVGKISTLRFWLQFFRCSVIPLRGIIVFATNRCNSRCKICGIWKEKQKQDLPAEIIEYKILKSKAVNNHKTFVTLSGGEFVLHPEAKEIVECLNTLGFNFTITTNGLATDRILELADEFMCKNFQISFDGLPETYREVTITPWTTLNDALHALEIAKKYKTSLLAGIYDNVKAFGTDFVGRVNMSEGLMRIFSSLDPFNYRYLAYYSKWLNGFRIPCLSIRLSSYIMPNGDVILCHFKDIVLGNIFEKDLYEIRSSYKVKRVLRMFSKCNDCYGYCHRAIDLALLNKKIVHFLI